MSADSQDRAPIDGVQVVLVVSGGRTGTRFLGTRLHELVPDCTSAHEPDMMNLRTPLRSLGVVRAFGVRHAVIDRLRGRSGIRVIGEAWLRGALDRDQAARRLRQQRRSWWTSRGTPLVVESYRQWFNVLDLLPDVVEQYKVVAIVRDPRSWVRSWMNLGGQYDRRDALTRVGPGRLEPADLGDQDNAARWPSMAVFERNAWYWGVVHERIARAAQADPRVRVFRFEDLFQGNREQTLAELLDFVCTWPDRRYAHRVDLSVLDRPVNVSTEHSFPPWTDWAPQQAAQLDRLCGTLMTRWGYGTEPDWRALLDVAG